MRVIIALLCMVPPLLALAVAGSNEQIVPSATDVSINGLHFDDTGHSGIHGTKISANVIQSGMFEFKIMGYCEDICEGIAKLKSDPKLTVPLRGVKYYNVSQSVISGWPAVVGVIEWDNSSEAGIMRGLGRVIGYIYVGDLKIRFSSVKGALEELKHLKIVAEPEMNLSLYSNDLKPYPTDLADCDSCTPTIIPINISRGGLYIAPGQFSTGGRSDQSWTHEASWYDHKHLHSDYSHFEEGDLKLDFQQNDSNGMGAAKTELTDLMRNDTIVKELLPSDIAYFNVSETMIGGWPAVVGVMNYSRHYTSGSSDLPVIYLEALIYVKNQKIITKIQEVLDPARQYEQMGEIRPSEKTVLDKMRSIKITLAPGASWW